MRKHLVIVGAGMATAYLLQELHAAKHEMQITVIGEERQACYNRVMLSGLLAGENTEDELAMLESGRFDSGVQFLLGKRVEQLHLQDKRVVTACGQVVSYDALVLATGAGIAGSQWVSDAGRGVQAMRSLQDVTNLRTSARPGARAVVVGGGLLGLEAAHGLNERGCNTLVLHRRAWLMNRQLDQEGGVLLQHKLEQRGMRFQLNDEPVAIETNQAGLKEIRLGSGKILHCDLLVLAPGILPNKTLGEQSGIAVDRGILVDEYLRTSDPAVYALGECSQMGDQCFGLVAPIREQSRILARQLKGQTAKGFVDQQWPTQLKISGIEIFSAGSIDAEGEELILRDADRGIYRRLVVRGGRLLSAVLVGDKRDGGWYQEMIQAERDLSAVRPYLMFGRDVSNAAEGKAQAA